MKDLKDQITQTRYVTFARSTTETPAALEAQQAAFRQHVAEHGGTILAHFTDTGDASHRDLRALMSRLTVGDCDALLITDVPRLGRGLSTTTLIDQVRRLGVRIETTGGPAANLALELHLAIRLYHAEYERESARRQISQIVAAGHNVGPVPFGYRTEQAEDGAGRGGPRRLVPEAVQGGLVGRAYDLFIETQNVGRAGQFLTDATGLLWTRARTRRLLASPAYRGTQVYGGKRNEHAHTPIVNRDKWDEAHHILDGQRVQVRRREQATRLTKPPTVHGSRPVRLT